jgi:hypothetical protein
MPVADSRGRPAVLIQRGRIRKTLAGLGVPTHIVERPYQTRAGTQHFKYDHERAARSEASRKSGIDALAQRPMRRSGGRTCRSRLTRYCIGREHHSTRDEQYQLPGRWSSPQWHV